MKTIFQTWRNSDLTEGRGPMVPDKAFSNVMDAREYIDKQTGVQGRSGRWSQEQFGDWQVRDVQVYESLDEALGAGREAIRRRALAKLTREEREVLGL